MARILITGGAGFVGSNLAHHFLQNYKDHEVAIFDNFSRKGVGHNVKWLREVHDHGVEVIKGDVRDLEALKNVAEGVELILHCAAQVAVTTSVKDPVTDFEVNSRGTLNVLEAARKISTDPIVVCCSTNKCYGDLSEVGLVELKTRYDFKNLTQGIDESFPLKPMTPYGVSKCLADLYCLDYHKTYGLKTVVFRMSCIFGTHQYGSEDQGFVAHFVISTVLEKPITVYGTGKQVRDLLYIANLCEAFDLAVKNIKRTKGNAYNIGGGPGNKASLLELIEYLESIRRKKIRLKFGEWRPSDQKVYYSNVTKAKEDFMWKPKTPWKMGVSKLYEWIIENKHLFS